MQRPGPELDTKSTEQQLANKKADEDKKEAERQRRIKEETQWYMATRGVVNNSVWKKISDNEDLLKEKQERENASTALVATKDSLATTKDGLYRYEGDDKLLKDTEILVKDGKASIHHPADFYKNPEKFEAQQRALIDKMVQDSGSDTLVIDFPSADKVDEEILKKMIAIAEEKHLYVQFGKSVDEYLLSKKDYNVTKVLDNQGNLVPASGSFDDLSHDERRYRYDKFHERLNNANDKAATFHKARVESLPHKVSEEKKKLEKAISQLNQETIGGEKKVDAVEIDKRIAKINTLGTEKEKLDAYQKELDQLQRRTDLLKLTKDELKTNLDSHEGNIKNANSLAEVTFSEQNQFERSKVILQVDREQAAIDEVRKKMASEIATLKDAVKDKANRIPAFTEFNRFKEEIRNIKDNFNKQPEHKKITAAEKELDALSKKPNNEAKIKTLKSQIEGYKQSLETKELDKARLINQLKAQPEYIAKKKAYYENPIKDQVKAASKVTKTVKGMTDSLTAIKTEATELTAKLKQMNEEISKQKSQVAVNPKKNG